MTAKAALPPIVPRLLDYRGLAAYLSTSERNAKTLGGPSGEIPQVKIGHLVRFDVRDVDAWIERRKREA